MYFNQLFLCKDVVNRSGVNPRVFIDVDRTHWTNPKKEFFTIRTLSCLELGNLSSCRFNPSPLVNRQLSLYEGFKIT